MMAPAAASSVMTRSVTAVGTPRWPASATTWSRLTAPVQQPDDVGRTAHARDGDRPARVHAHLHGVPVTPQRLQTRSQCRPHSWKGATRGPTVRTARASGRERGRKSPGRQAVRPPSPEAASGPGPGDPLAGEARLAGPAGQAHPVDAAVHNVGSTRRVAVDTCARRCELPGQTRSRRPLISQDSVHVLWTEIAAANLS